jgi:small-conductance mechanosensitive channel
MNVIQQIKKLLMEIFHIDESAMVRVLITISIIILFSIFRSVFLNIAFKKTFDTKKFHALKQVSGYIIVLLFIVLAIQIWSEGFTHIATFMGLLTAGIAIALKDIVANIAAWIYILINKPFQIGDRIQLDIDAGDVIEIQPLYFTVLEIGKWVDADQSTGRIISIPNNLLFAKPLINYTKTFEYIWNEIGILVTFESNWELAKKLFGEIIKKRYEQFAPEARDKVRLASKKMMIIYPQLTPIVYTSVKDNGIMLTMRYLCEPRKRRNSEMILWEEILKIVKNAPEIEFAYNTLRIYKNGEESPIKNPTIQAR